MKKVSKQILCILCVCLMLSYSTLAYGLAVETAAFAENQVLTVDSQKVAELDKRLSNSTPQQIKDILINEYGATEEVAEELLRLTNNTNALQSRSGQARMARASGFPSNPYIGQQYTKVFTVYISVGASAAGIAANILSKTPYVSMAAALTTAGLILGLGASVFGSTVTLKLNYTYGPTNDGVLGWTPGYIEIVR